MNTEAVAVSIGTKGIDELVKVVDEDGDFRSGRGNVTGQQPLKKGGGEPKKQI